MSVTLVHVTTVPMTIEFFMRGQIPYMKRKGFEVIAVSSWGEGLERVAERDGIIVHAVPMVRGISPWKDLVALVSLWRLFKAIRPDIVHSSTGKAGPLAMLAAVLAGVPARVYSLRGIMIDRRTGAAQRMLRLMEWLTCRCAHRVLAVSRSVSDLMVREKLCPAEKITVPANGSSNGVDAINRFNKAVMPEYAIRAFRQLYRIPERDPVIGFVGRVVTGKGIGELHTAWEAIKEHNANVRLVIAGPVEAHDPVPNEVLEDLRNDDRVIMIAYVPNDQMPCLYASTDVIVLPTYSEGFPNVLLEAAAMGLPVVATRVTGCVDAVLDTITGTLVPPRNSAALEKAVSAYLEDPELRAGHGKAARERVLREFGQEPVWESLCLEYERLLEQRRVPTQARHRTGKAAAVHVPLGDRHETDGLSGMQLNEIPLDPSINMLSIDVECWDQIICRNLTGETIPPSETCVEGTRYLLSLFREKGVKATFFVVGSVAEAFPDLVREIDSQGHEVAAHGFTHTPVHRLTVEAFRDEVGRSASLFHQILGKPVRGFRAPAFSIVRETMWALDVLWEHGFKYDSSIFPFAGPRYGVADFSRGVVRMDRGKMSLIEVPPSVLRLFGANVPVAGGGYFRLLPYGLTRSAVRRVNLDGRPFVLYGHSYEFGPDRLSCKDFPRPFSKSRAMQIEVKSNMFKRSVPEKLSRLLGEFRFSSIREVLGHAAGF